MNQEHYSSWMYGSNSDVKLSLEDYYEIVDILRDERMSPKMKFKFKNLWEINAYSTIYVPMYAAPLAYFASKWATGPADRALTSWKFRAVWFSFFVPCISWYLYTLPVPRRLYTEVMADETSDGDYIRSRIKVMKPLMWAHISQQLHQQGYEFKQINELTSSREFATAPVQYN